MWIWMHFSLPWNSAMIQVFEENLLRLEEIANGVKADRVTKSVSAENTFEVDLVQLDDMLHAIERICESVVRRLQKSNLKGKTVTLKIRDRDFDMVTRSFSPGSYISSFEEIFNTSATLMRDNMPPKPVRLLGVGISNLNNLQKPMHGQLTLDF